MALLLAEELALLCMDDETGQCLLPTSDASQGVARALVYELTLRGTLELKGERLLRDGTLPLPDEVLELAAERATGQDVGAAVEALADEDLLRVMLTRLVARGALHDAEVWATGRHLPKNPHHEARVRERLSFVLLRGADPSEHDAAMIALLQQLDLTTQVFPDADPQVLRHRAEKIADQAGPMAQARRGSKGWFDGADILELIALPLRLLS